MADFLGGGLFTRVLQAGQVGLWQSCGRLPLWGGRSKASHQQQSGPGTSPQSGIMTKPGLQCGFNHADGNKA